MKGLEGLGVQWEKKALQRFEGKGGVVFAVEMRRQGKSSEVNNRLQWERKEVMKQEQLKKTLRIFTSFKITGPYVGLLI